MRNVLTWGSGECRATKNVTPPRFTSVMPSSTATTAPAPYSLVPERPRPTPLTPSAHSRTPQRVSAAPPTDMTAVDAHLRRALSFLLIDDAHHAKLHIVRAVDASPPNGAAAWRQSVDVAVSCLSALWFHHDQPGWFEPFEPLVTAGQAPFHYGALIVTRTALTVRAMAKRAQDRQWITQVAAPYVPHARVATPPRSPQHARHHINSVLAHTIPLIHQAALEHEKVAGVPRDHTLLHACEYLAHPTPPAES